MNYIHHHAVFVEEPHQAHFQWVLIEGTEDASAWNDIEASASSYDMWLDALTAGNKALNHVEDECIGPRAFGEEEDASPVGS